MAAACRSLPRHLRELSGTVQERPGPHCTGRREIPPGNPPVPVPAHDLHVDQRGRRFLHHVSDEVEGGAGRGRRRGGRRGGHGGAQRGPAALPGPQQHHRRCPSAHRRRQRPAPCGRRRGMGRRRGWRRWRWLSGPGQRSAPALYTRWHRDAPDPHSPRRCRHAAERKPRPAGAGQSRGALAGVVVLRRGPPEAALHRGARREL